MKGKTLLSTAVAASALAALPSAALAANPYTPKEICGSGFSVLASQPLTMRSDSDRVAARTYLMYNAATGENCATTIKRAAVGRPTFVAVGLSLSGRKGPSEGRAFEYYAGPVKVKAPGRCIDWSGSFRIGARNGGGFERVKEFCR